MIPLTWTAAHPRPVPKRPLDTTISYRATCQDCDGEATMVQTTRELQGVGEGGLITCDYTRRCPTCDGQAS